MLKIGCHLSSSGGFLAMARTAVEIDANTFQFFTRNPRGGAVRAQDDGDIAAFLAFAAEHALTDWIAHAPYTLNACAEKENVLSFTRQTMADDLRRLKDLPGVLYNFHPGSHVGQGVERGIALIAETLNEVVKPDTVTPVLLETMSGKGSEVGGRFEELRAIIDAVPQNRALGVCLDTCHVFDAGYDIVNNLDGVLAEFDRSIGLNRLKAIHLNDSKNPCGSRKDRHETLGNGTIGLMAFDRLINHPALQHLPFCLETPNELPGYAAEIALLRGMYTNTANE